MAITTWLRSLGGTGATENARRAVEVRRATDAYVDAAARRLTARPTAPRRNRRSRQAA